MIKRRSEYEYFFGRLNSPDWIGPMLDLGLFSTPPATVREGDYLKFPAWAEAEYLARVASKLPEHAARALLSVPESDNVHVHVALAEVAVHIAPKDAAEWARRELVWVESQKWLFMLLPQKLSRVVKFLAENGEKTAALGLARSVLGIVPDPRADQTSAEPYRLPPQPRGKCDVWEYAKALGVMRPALQSAAGVGALDLMSDLLERAIVLSRADPSAVPPTDYSFIWRNAIESGERGTEDVRDVLISAVRDAAVELSSSSGARHIVERLESRRWTVFRRIALHVVREYGSEEFDLLREHLLVRKAFDDVEVRHEYALLLQKYFARLKDVDQSTILGWVDVGPDREEMRQRHRERSGNELPAELERHWVEQWQRDRLSPVRGFLSEPWRSRFEAWVRDFGEPQFDFGASTISMSLGHPSPIDGTEAAGMSSEQLHTFLREWTPEQVVGATRREGVAETLRGLGDSFLQRELGVASRWSEFHPTYVTELLRGARDLVGKGARIPWEQVVELGEKLDRAADTPEASWMREALLTLLISGVDSATASPATELSERILGILMVELEAAREYPTESAGRYGVDTLSRAINSFQGKAVESVIRFAVWRGRSWDHKRGTLRLEREEPGIASALARWLAARTDQALLARPVFGLHLESLTWLDPHWVRSHTDALFPSNPEWTPFYESTWLAYLEYARPYEKSLEYFRAQYLRSVSQLSSASGEPRGERAAPSKLAEHLMVYYWQGFLPRESADEMLERFFDQAPLSLRAHAIGFIGRSLHGAEELHAEVSERLFSLLDWRESVIERISASPDRRREAAELRQFGWWCESPLLPAERTLGHLKKVLLLAGAVEPDHVVAESLVAWSREHPLMVADSLKLLIEGAEEEWAVASWREEANAILQVLFKSSDERVLARARAIVQSLLERGLPEFRELLRAGRSTTDDARV